MQIDIHGTLKSTVCGRKNSRHTHPCILEEQVGAPEVVLSSLTHLLGFFLLPNVYRERLDLHSRYLELPVTSEIRDIPLWCWIFTNLMNGCASRRSSRSSGHAMSANTSPLTPAQDTIRARCHHGENTPSLPACSARALPIPEALPVMQAMVFLKQLIPDGWSVIKPLRVSRANRVGVYGPAMAFPPEYA